MDEERWMRRIAMAAIVATFAFGALVIAGEAATPGNTRGQLQVGPWEVRIPPGPFERHNRAITGVLSIVAGLCLVVMSAAGRRARGWPRRTAFAVVVVTVVGCGAVALSRNAVVRPEAFDLRDDFQYFMTAKYFRELGYFGHFECALWAEKQAGRSVPPQYRDQRSGRLRASRAMLSRGAPACRSAFSDERWRQFEADSAFFSSRLRAWGQQWPLMFKDHSFNGTPVLRALIATTALVVPVGHASLGLLGLLNLFVVLAAMLVVSRWVGWREAIVLALLLFTYSGEAFGHVGSGPRYFWLASLLIGIAALHRERFGLAGALLALSSSLKLFPVLWFGGPLLVFAIGSFLRGTPEERARMRRGAIRLAGAAAVTGAALFGWSFWDGHGLQDWVDFMSKMDENASRLTSARLGYKFNFLRPLLEARGYHEALTNYEAPLVLGVTPQHLHLVSGGALAALAAFRAARSSVAQASVLLGFTVLFVFLAPVRYYYAAFLGVSLLFVFDRQPRAFLASSFVLLGIAGAGALAHTRTSEELRFNVLHSIALAVYVAGLLVVWELADWRRRHSRVPITQAQ